MPRRKRRHDSSSSSSSSDSSSSSPISHESRKKRKSKRKGHTPKSYTPPPVSLVSTLSSPTKPFVTYAQTMESVSFIPEFDPLVCQVDQWLEIIDHNSKNYVWTDSFTVYQALGKLQGTARTWYTSFIETEPGWSQFDWNRWKHILRCTFHSSRNTYNIFMDIATHTPKAGSSLYEFHFAHLAKINKLRVNFSDSDKVSLIVSSAIEAAGINDSNLLASYLRNKFYKNNKLLLNDSQSDNNNIPGPSNTARSTMPLTVRTGKNPKRCTCCGGSGHEKYSCRHRNKACNFCKYAGHIERNCLKKQSSERLP